VLLKPEVIVVEFKVNEPPEKPAEFKKMYAPNKSTDTAAFEALDTVRM